MAAGSLGCAGLVGGATFAQLGPPAPYLVGAGLALLAVGVLAVQPYRSAGGEPASEYVTLQ